jgi:hypothetical protein
MRIRKALKVVFVVVALSCGGCGSDSGDGRCVASEGESCDPDSCPCEGFPSGPVECLLMPSGSANLYECVDTTPQNKPLGDSCVFNFECASDHCYDLTGGNARICQDTCVAAGTTYTGEDPGGIRDDCCGGYASCTGGTCTCH